MKRSLNTTLLQQFLNHEIESVQKIEIGIGNPFPSILYVEQKNSVILE